MNHRRKTQAGLAAILMLASLGVTQVAVAQVTSIVRQTPADQIVNATTTSLTWRVTFDEDIDSSTIGADDFAVTGATGTTIGAPAMVGSDASMWDVTVTGGQLEAGNLNRAEDGTYPMVSLGFAAGAEIMNSDGVAIGLATSDVRETESYSVDNTAPQVVSIRLVANNDNAEDIDSPSNVDAFRWRVAFDSAITGLATAPGGFNYVASNTQFWDFSVQNTDGDEYSYHGRVVSGTNNREFELHVRDTVGSDTQAVSTYEGQLTLSLRASTHNIADPAGNALADIVPANSGENDNTIILDHVKPTIEIVARADESSSSAVINRVAPGDEFVVHITLTDGGGEMGAGTGFATSGAGAFTSLDIDRTGASTRGALTCADASASPRLCTATMVVADPIPANGVTMSIPNGVTDGAGNENEASNMLVITSAETIAIQRQTPADENTNAASLTWRVTFLADVDATTITAADFAVGGATGTTIAAPTMVGSDAAVWDVTVTGGQLQPGMLNRAGDGTYPQVTLGFATDAAIMGSDSNAIDLSMIGLNDAYGVDNTGPQIESIRLADMQATTSADAPSPSNRTGVRWQVRFVDSDLTGVGFNGVDYFAGQSPSLFSIRDSADNEYHYISGCPHQPARAPLTWSRATR